MKTAVITGGNSGIGLETARALVQRGFAVILLVRNEAKGRAAVAELQRLNPPTPVELVVADLTDAASVRRAAEQIRATHPHLDVLINNAGYSPDAILFTPDGIEQSFYANHVGHFVLTYHLLDRLKASGAGRIINVSSSAYKLGRAKRFFGRQPNLRPLAAYGDSKLANVLFTQELARRFGPDGLTAYAVHPGVVRSNFGGNFTGVSGLLVRLFRPFMRSSVQGAATSVFLATAPVSDIGAANNGAFFVNAVSQPIRHRDLTAQHARQLWERSLAFV